MPPEVNLFDTANKRGPALRTDSAPLKDSLLYNYALFSKTRASLFRTLKLLTIATKQIDKNDVPVYILNCIKSSELELNTFLRQDDPLENQMMHGIKEREEQIAKKKIIVETFKRKYLKNKENGFTILDYDSFDQILQEFDRYSAPAASQKKLSKTKTPSIFGPSKSTSVSSFMKSNGLSSLTEPRIQDSAFRRLDLRLRVYLYDINARHSQNINSIGSFFNVVANIETDADGKREAEAGFRGRASKGGVSVSEEQQIERLKSLQEIMANRLLVKQRCLFLGLVDLLLMAIDRNDVQEAGPLLNCITLMNQPSQQGQDSLPLQGNTALFSRTRKLEDIINEKMITSNWLLKEMKESGELQEKHEPKMISSTNWLLAATNKLATPRQEVIMRLFDYLPTSIKKTLKNKTNLNHSRYYNLYKEKPGNLVYGLTWTMRALYSLIMIIKYRAITELSGHPSPIGSSSLFVDFLPPDKPCLEYLIPKMKLHLRRVMEGMAIEQKLSIQKLAETKKVTDRLRALGKKDLDNRDSLKNLDEFDHLVNSHIRFGALSAELRKGQLQSNNGQRIADETEFSLTSLFNPQKPMLELRVDVENDRIEDCSNSSYLIAHQSLLASSYSFILSQLIKCLLQEQSNIFVKQAEQFAILRGKIVAVNPRLSLSVLNTVRRKREQVFMMNQVLASQSAVNHLPFITNFYSRFLSKSFNMSINGLDEGYICSREDYVKLVADLVKDSSFYCQELYDRVNNHYLRQYTAALYSRFTSSHELYLAKQHFLKLLKNYHKIVEERLAEENLGTIFVINQLYQYIRHNLYDGKVVIDKLRLHSLEKYGQSLTRGALQGQDLADRQDQFGWMLSLAVKDFVFQQHNLNMGSLEEKLSKVLGEKVDLFDEGQKISQNQIEQLVDSGAITLGSNLVENMKEYYREKVRALDDHLSQNKIELNEQTAKDDNVKKKIRELIVKEDFMKEELQKTKAEMEALTQQNHVLERDIHTCNFERINLTTQLQDIKDKVESLRKDVSQSQLQRSLSRSRQSLKPGAFTPPAHLPQRQFQEGRPIQEDEELVSSDEENIGGSISHNVANQIGSREYAEMEQNYGQTKGENPYIQRKPSKQKKNKFVFNNGKLERRFCIRK